MNSPSALIVNGVSPLDDPENPYLGQYGPWDVWTYENQGGVEFGKFSPPERGPGEYFMATMVDEAGFMVPYLKLLKMQQEANVARDSSMTSAESHYWVWAISTMDQSLVDATYAAGWDVRAEYYEQVPDWLASNPPHKAVLLPNGQVITVGLPGSGVELSSEDGEELPDGCCNGNPDNIPYYLFSADGTPIAGTQTEHWFYLYYDELERGEPEGVWSRRRDGYVIFKNEDGLVSQVYEYDGTLLDFSIEPPLRGTHKFTELKGSALIDLHEAQERIGKT